MVEGGPAAALDGARILIVEDDFFIIMELDSILEWAGVEVIGPCRTLAQARREIEKAELMAAILDYRLGADTSLPTARQLAQRGVPFVFFTGQVDASDIRAEYPGARIIAKPFQRQAILSALAATLAHP